MSRRLRPFERSSGLMRKWTRSILTWTESPGARRSFHGRGAFEPPRDRYPIRARPCICIKITKLVRDEIRELVVDGRRCRTSGPPARKIPALRRRNGNAGWLADSVVDHGELSERCCQISRNERGFHRWKMCPGSRTGQGKSEKKWGNGREFFL